MFVGCDHQMAAGVRIAIQNHEIESCAMNNQCFLVARPRQQRRKRYSGRGRLCFSCTWSATAPTDDPLRARFLALRHAALHSLELRLFGLGFGTVHQIAQFFAGFKERDSL